MASVWVLVSEDVGRWMRQLVMVSGVTLVMGASTTVMGYLLLNNAGIPALLGIAWLPTLAAGILMLLGGMNAKKRLVSTWFGERPTSSNPRLSTGVIHNVDKSLACHYHWRPHTLTSRKIGGA